MDERRNRQGRIRVPFWDEGRGILATLEKGLENLKAPEDGVNMKNSAAWVPASCAVFHIVLSHLPELLVFLTLRNGAWIPRPSSQNTSSIFYLPCRFRTLYHPEVSVDKPEFVRDANYVSCWRGADRMSVSQRGGCYKSRDFKWSVQNTVCSGC